MMQQRATAIFPRRLSGAIPQPLGAAIVGPFASCFLQHGKNMPGRKPVILIVEDEPMIRMGAVDFVIAAGFEALEAASALDAIRILEARPDIHLLFTDVGLPGTMDGIKLAHY